MKVLGVALLFVAPLIAASKAELALKAEIARLQTALAVQAKATQIAQTAATQAAQGQAAQTGLAKAAASDAARAREALADQASKSQESLALLAIQNQNTLAQVTKTVAREKASAAAATAKTLSTLDTNTKTAAQKADEVRQAQNDNAGAAAVAVEDAKAAAAEQAAATERLAQAAAAAKRADDAMLQSAKTSQLNQYGTMLALVIGFATLLWKGYTDSRTHDWEREATKAEVKAVIVSEIKTSTAERDADNAVQETGIMARLASMTAQYLITRTRELSAMRKALNDGDFETLAWLAHNLAGTGTSFGYPEVSRLGKLMENAARGKDQLSFEDLLETFTNYVHSVPSPDLTTLAAPASAPRAA